MYRPHPLRQSQTVDYSISRQASTTSSSASSGYSNSSDRSFASSMSSTHSRDYPSWGHKRGQSEASRLSTSFSGAAGTPPKTSLSATTDNIYNTARRSLRPLPQAPASPQPLTLL